MQIHERIKKRREELGLSQSALASMLDYKSDSTIAKIEKGINDIPQAKIKSFADALDTTPSWLLGFDEETNTSQLVDFKRNAELLTDADYKFADAEVVKLMDAQNEMQASYGGADLAFESIEDEERFKATIKQTILNVIVHEREGLLSHISRSKWLNE